MKLRISTLLFFVLGATMLFAQQPTDASKLEQSILQKEQMRSASIVKNVPFKSIGPTVMSGRIVDLAVNPEDPTEFYAAYASGGLWHTKNNGISFTPVMDNSPTQNIGDIAVDWKNGTIWVGTGENNSSRSSYAGIGILKSTDRGATWQNMGLYDSHHIGGIVINPDNPDEVVVGAVGHLYSTNEERGIYKTIDGGKNWTKTLFVSEDAGIIDLISAPGNFEILFASAWEKDRKAWNFDGSGSASGIYKSTDGGDSWTLISTENSGFPTGAGVGRIGLAAFSDQVIYAVHDSQFRRKEEPKKETSSGLTKDDLRTMSTEAFLKLDEKVLNGFLRQNNFQEKYRAENVKTMVRSQDVKPIDLVKYLEDANSQLFDTPVIGAEVYRSEDGGTSWKKVNEDNLEGLFYSYGYYFAFIRVDPNDREKIYIGGVPLIKSADGGKTWKSISAENVHSDHHSLWINPDKPGHLINGNDGGLNISYDDGETWIKNNSTPVGQFYAITTDNEKPYNIYGGLQDNGVWVGAHNARQDRSWEQSGHYPWESIMGGDGMQIQVDNRDANVVYTGFQFGNYYRLDRKTGNQVYIQPKHELGESPYRFNWQTPILLSSHNQDILYLGGNKLMRSMNQGNDWTAISDDLTKGGKPGNVAYGTLTAISESPFQFGLLYTGSDDGIIQLSRDAGGNWTDISKNLPADLWVSRVVASQHKKSRVYATLNGYRWDDFTPYVYKSEDYGQTWTAIVNNLPLSPVNVIAEDPQNEDLLYLGTDDAAYVSFDMGQSWEIFNGSFPAVAVHDLTVQETENDLILGTHGRSIYLADINNLQKLKTDKLSELQVFEIPAVRHSGRWGSSRGEWSEPFTPETEVVFYAPVKETASIQVLSEQGKVLKSWNLQADKGFNFVAYDLTLSESGKKELDKNKEVKINKADNGLYYLSEGKYTLEISLGQQRGKTELEIKGAR